MSNAPQTYVLDQKLRDLLLQEFGTLKKQNVLFEQSLREQQTQAAAATEALFLELWKLGML